MQTFVLSLLEYASMTPAQHCINKTWACTVHYLHSSHVGALLWKLLTLLIMLMLRQTTIYHSINPLLPRPGYSDSEISHSHLNSGEGLKHYHFLSQVQL